VTPQVRAAASKQGLFSPPPSMTLPPRDFLGATDASLVRALIIRAQGNEGIATECWCRMEGSPRFVPKRKYEGDADARK
jgi:hypothetical protein